MLFLTWFMKQFPLDIAYKNSVLENIRPLSCTWYNLLHKITRSYSLRSGRGRFGSILRPPTATAEYDLSGALLKVSHSSETILHLDAERKI